jgi:hypothetical protein
MNASNGTLTGFGITVYLWIEASRTELIAWGLPGGRAGTGRAGAGEDAAGAVAGTASETLQTMKRSE